MERFVDVNGLTLWCEDFGSADDPALLLVPGATAQGVAWTVPFCEALAAGGLRVIRFDTRDTGRSSSADFEEHPYTVADMAVDAFCLLDAIGIDRAHVLGLSMGGMVAQEMALTRPERVVTLTAFSTTPAVIDPASPTGWTGGLPPTDPTSWTFVPEGPLETLEQITDFVFTTSSFAAGSGYPVDRDELRASLAESIARSGQPDRSGNHGLAIMRSTDRTERLRGLRVPTLVLHGDEDKGVPLGHGEALAQAIPGAKLVVLRGWGHEFPRGGVVPLVVDALHRHIRTATEVSA